MATHSSILAWRIPWMEEPGGLQSTGSQRVRHDWATSLSLYIHTHHLFFTPWWNCNTPALPAHEPCCKQCRNNEGHVYTCVCVTSVVPDSLRLRGLQPARLLCPGNPPGQNTGVGCHALLQGIFPTQGLNPGLPHCRQILYFLSTQEAPLRGKYLFK